MAEKQKTKKPPKKPNKKLRTIGYCAALGVYLVFGFWSFTQESSDFSRLHFACKRLKRGHSLEQARAIASDYQMIFENDPAPIGNPKGEPFLLKPTERWPRTFACKFAAEFGLITEVRR